MALINLLNGYLSFSDAPLLDHVNLAIEANERVCLVGRNGAGKSTLLKVLAKATPLDEGQVVYADNLVVARLEQDPPKDTAGTVFDYVATGLAEQAALLTQYHHLSQLVEQQPTEQHLKQLAALGEQLEQQNGWQLDNRIHNVLAQLGLKADSELASLSGGWLRKAALARALVSEPDVLLLDEPTNHLDVVTIEWLENFLQSFRGSLVFISHDRAFIVAMATRIVDLDRGQIVSFAGDYTHYLQAKEDMLRVEAQQNALFDKRLAQEEVWIRQGIKARRTRNEGRVRALKAMRQQYASRRQVMGNSKMQLEEALRSGKIVFEVEHLNYAIDGKTLIKDFSAQVLRGEKIALIGGNGCGKTTLIKLLLQQLQPDSGRVHCGTKLEIAYFDQHRAVLDPEKSVMDNLADGKQEITVNGRSRHVLGYLQDFLFAPKRAMTPVKALSGGERNRLLLAKLFLKPSNLLILDEPTNDLDVETLELLEERVSDYQGTLLLVSHDRQFVDNAVSQCWFFEGDGQISSYPGGYFDALAQQQNRAPKATVQPKAPLQPQPVANKPQAEPRNSVQKLSYNEKRELAALPQLLEQLEAEITTLQQTISHEQFFQQDHAITQPILTELADKEQQLEQAFARWEELEARQ